MKVFFFKYLVVSVLCSKCPPGIEGSLRNALSLERREKLPKVPFRRRWDVSATRADTLIEKE